MKFKIRIKVSFYTIGSWQTYGKLLDAMIQTVDKNINVFSNFLLKNGDFHDA